MRNIYLGKYHKMNGDNYHKILYASLRLLSIFMVKTALFYKKGDYNERRNY